MNYELYAAVQCLFLLSKIKIQNMDKNICIVHRQVGHGIRSQSTLYNIECLYCIHYQTWQIIRELIALIDLTSVTKTTAMGGGKTSLLIFLIILLILLNLLKILLKPLWRFLLGSRLPLIVRTPAERFAGLEKLGYDFRENFLRFAKRC